MCKIEGEGSSVLFAVFYLEEDSGGGGEGAVLQKLRNPQHILQEKRRDLT